MRPEERAREEALEAHAQPEGEPLVPGAIAGKELALGSLHEPEALASGGWEMRPPARG
jgi:hypothetical protein